MTPENQNVPVCGLAVALCSAILAADAKLLAEHPQLFADDPSCPACGHKHCAHWNGGISGVSWREFRGTSLSRNDGDDGDREEIKCPNCGTAYVVTLHVQRIVTLKASLANIASETRRGQSQEQKDGQ